MLVPLAICCWPIFTIITVTVRAQCLPEQGLILLDASVSQSDSGASKQDSRIFWFLISVFVSHSSTSQVLGFEVDSINSVQFSNHTGGSSA